MTKCIYTYIGHKKVCGRLHVTNTAEICNPQHTNCARIQEAIEKFCNSVLCTNGTDKTVTLFFNVISPYINTFLTSVKKVPLFQPNRISRACCRDMWPV